MEFEFFALGFGAAATGVAGNGIWATFVGFLSSILTGINTVTGNFGISIILFTILMRGLLLPLDMKSRESMKKVGEIQPLLQKVNEKYKDDPEKKNKKTMEIYQEHKVSPFGGCLPMLLQMPLLFAMFAALQRIASYELGIFLMEYLEQISPAVALALDQVSTSVASSDTIRESMVNIIRQIFANPQAPIVQRLIETAGEQNVTVIVDAVRNANNTDVLEFLNNARFDSFRFLWIRNIWVADSPLMTISGSPDTFLSPFRNGFFILPILSAATAYLLTKVQPMPGGQQANQLKGMNAIMPFMSLWFTATANAGFALYWVINNIFQIAYFMIYNHLKPVKKEGTAK